MENVQIKTLPTNWAEQIAKKVGCCRQTVWNAVRNNRKSEIAEKCRIEYKKLLGIKEQITIL